MRNFMFTLANAFAGVSFMNDEFGTEVSEIYNAFSGVMDVLLPIILAVLVLIGVVYGISLGMKFAKAEDSDARDKAKGQLINMCIGIGVAIVFIVICMFVVDLDFIQGLFPTA